MENFCLTRKDYKDFLNHLLYEKGLENNDLEYIIERAKDYFDCNIIGSNYYLSIIIEQLLKNDELDNGLLKAVYQLQQTLYFTIEEHDYKFVNELYNNHLPNACNKHRQEYNIAIQRNDIKTIDFLKLKNDEPFEEDLDRIMNTFYEA